MTAPSAPAPARTSARIALHRHFPGAYEALSALNDTVEAGPIEPFLLELVKLRASQVNGCAYCIDMHTKDARAMGESEERMHLVAAWRESPHFTQRERVALALAEAVTLITDGHVPEDVWAAAEAEFDPDELVCLVWACAVINTWNRVAITTRSQPGAYRSTRQRVERAATA
ncbi:MAG: carboxymuconolactone decarboxylase family protein [Acidimicrobiia bacterium]|nr:carboxymuconolactone decarboxylase family protein [Acidimicrobiia bacterium]